MFHTYKLTKLVVVIYRNECKINCHDKWKNGKFIRHLVVDHLPGMWMYQRASHNLLTMNLSLFLGYFPYYHMFIIKGRMFKEISEV